MSLPRHHRPAAAVGAGLIAVLALGACSASGSTGSSAGAGVSAVAPANPDLGGAPDAAPDAAADAQKLAESSGQGAAAGSPGSGTAARNASPSSAADVAAADKLVRTASLQVQVDDVEAKAAEARQVALAAGGTVVSENSSAVPVSSGGVDKQGSRSTMSLSVPADTLDRVLDDLGKLGTTVQRSSSARDVTSTYVDTQSRITTMKAGLDQVRTLLGKTTDLNQIISLETEIARRQGDLDSLQAQLNSLDKKVAMSTVSVTLVTAANVVVPEEDTLRVPRRPPEGLEGVPGRQQRAAHRPGRRPPVRGAARHRRRPAAVVASSPYRRASGRGRVCDVATAGGWFPWPRRWVRSPRRPGRVGWPRWNGPGGRPGVGARVGGEGRSRREVGDRVDPIRVPRGLRSLDWWVRCGGPGG